MPKPDNGSLGDRTETDPLEVLLALKEDSAFRALLVVVLAGDLAPFDIHVIST